MTQALDRGRPGRTPRCSARSSIIVGVLALPDEVLAAAGRVREGRWSSAANWRDEPLPGLSREELLAIVG